MFVEESHFTDDSVMTRAVAEALLDSFGKMDDDIRRALVRSMRRWGRKFPHAGCGARFYRWLHMRDPKPYNRFGNGSAMRVCSATIG